MSDTIIDSLYKDFESIIGYLDVQGEISYKNIIENNFKKNFIISIASYFEHMLKDIISKMTLKYSGNNEIMLSFVKSTALDRQFHTFFEWDSGNANKFFSLFGSDFKGYMKETVKNDENLEKSIKAFMRIGSERNKLVHQNFASYPIDNITAKEFYQIYKDAIEFVNKLPNFFDNYIEKAKSA